MDWLRQFPIGQSVDASGPEGGSWLRTLDPRLKLAWTVAFLVTPILAGPAWRLALVALLLLLTLCSGLPLRIWRRSLPLLLALALLVGQLTALLPAGTTPRFSLQRPPKELRLEPAPAGASGPSPSPAGQAAAPESAGLRWEVWRWGPLQLGPATIGPLVVTRRSAELAINSATLLVTLIHSANLLLLSTTPEELAWAISWWLAPLSRLGLPMERLGFTLLLALRFLPLVQEELQNLLRAIAIRAVNLRELGWKAGLSLVLAVGERLLANILLRSEQGAEALLARGGRWLPPDALHRASDGSRSATLLGWLALALMLVLRWRYGTV
ncbi:MAG: CbiQ family ECF transporter T component [Vulcanococcus sp.]